MSTMTPTTAATAATTNATAATAAAATAAMTNAAATASFLAGVSMDPFKMSLREVAEAAAANGANAAAAAAATADSSAADGKTAPAVDVTRHNFEVMLPVVKRYLAACDYFAFDCEMTGLFLEGQTENYLDDMQDRYSRYSAAAQSFVITQFGLSCFRRCCDHEGEQKGEQEGEGEGEGQGEQEGGRGGAGPSPSSSSSPSSCPTRYLAATFNFYLFPRPQEGSAYGTSRRFLCDAGSLSFLASQGFDFNRCIYDGVPFMPVRQRDELLRQIDRDNGGGGGGAGGEGGGRADVALTKPEDQAFVQGLLASVHEWLAGSSPEPLDLPTVNRYLRLLTYQALARPENFGGPPGGAPGWHPGFHVKKVSDERGWTRVRLIRCATAAEAAALEVSERAERRAAVAAAAGFGAVWEALQQCGRPGVGHNCMFDVAYGIAQFGEGRLPATWEGFKRATANWFRGGLYDTKHICRLLPDVLGSDTSLAVMYGSLLVGPQQPPAGAAASAPSAPSIPSTPSAPSAPARVSVRHAAGFEKYVSVAAGQCAHEAGYDAFMTGSVFAALEGLLAERGGGGSGSGSGSGGGSVEGDKGVVAAVATAAAAAEAGGDVVMGDTEEPVASAVPRPAPYASVAPYMWRLNVTRSDLPYALLRPAVPGDPTSQEPVPERPLVFHLGNLSYGVRAYDIQRACEEAGLGKVRVSFLPGSNAFIELETEQAAVLLSHALKEKKKTGQEGQAEAEAAEEGQGAAEEEGQGAAAQLMARGLCAE
ncbi:hypothetical protein PLESTM_002076300, partial [Pleodorina starrii]